MCFTDGFRSFPFVCNSPSLRSRCTLAKHASSLKIKFFSCSRSVFYDCSHGLFPSLFAWPVWQVSLTLEKRKCSSQQFFYFYRNCFLRTLLTGWHASTSTSNICHIEALESNYESLFCLFPEITQKFKKFLSF